LYNNTWALRSRGQAGRRKGCRAESHERGSSTRTACSYAHLGSFIGWKHCWLEIARLGGRLGRPIHKLILATPKREKPANAKVDYGHTQREGETPPYLYEPARGKRGTRRALPKEWFGTEDGPPDMNPALSIFGLGEFSRGEERKGTGGVTCEKVH